MDKPKPTVCAYTAGFFDAEGTITGSAKQPTIAVRIYQNNSPVLLTQIQASFGGTLYTYDKEYQLAFGIDEIIPFLKHILPYLKLKRLQAYMAMAYVTSSKRGKKRETRQRLIRKIQEQNQQPKRDRLPYLNTNPNRTALAYIAGFLDGDGCVSVSPTRSLSRLKIATCREQLVDWVEKVMGGTTIHHSQPNEKWNDSYEWQIAAEDEKLRAIDRLLPYVRSETKRDKLKFILDQYPSSPQSIRWSPPDEGDDVLDIAV